MESSKASVFRLSNKRGSEKNSYWLCKNLKNPTDSLPTQQGKEQNAPIPQNK